MIDSLTQLDENNRRAFRELEERLVSLLTHREAAVPGLDLEKYIPMKKAAEMLGVAAKTLSAHKDQIGYSNCFGKIFLDKQGLINYMDSGKPEIKVKSIMRTRKAA